MAYRRSRSPHGMFISPPGALGAPTDPVVGAFIAGPLGALVSRVIQSVLEAAVADKQVAAKISETAPVPTPKKQGNVHSPHPARIQLSRKPRKRRKNPGD